MNEELTEMVVNQAEALESMDSFEELEVLDVEILSDVEGTVRQVRLILTTGGPHIEANATKGTVSGYWGGESHTTHCDADVLDRAEEYYRHTFENGWKH